MKEFLWQIYGCFYLVIIFLIFSIQHLVDNYQDWRDWKRSVKDEIDHLCERVEDADTAP